MKYLFDAAQSTAQPNDLVLAFFFHARGSNLEKSTAGMYRSLLHQLLRAIPDLQIVLDSHNGSAWTVNKLHKLFMQAVARLRSQRLTLFVDALDECAEEEGLAMVRRFQRQAKDAFANAVTFRICFSSRPYPVVDMRKGIEIVLEEQSGHEQDLRHYVRAELSGSIQDSHIEHVIRKANGVFLWAVLVVGLLSRDWRQGRTDAAQIQQRLEELPPHMSELFREVINANSNDNEDLKLCVQWLLYGEHKLNPFQYYWMVRIGSQSAILDTLEPWDRDEITPPEVLHNFVVTTSRGLAEITAGARPRVQFIHESVRDYLLKGNG